MLSYNRPRFNPYTSWVRNGITFATSAVVGGTPWGLFVDVNNTVYLANRESSRIYIWREGSTGPSRNYTLPLSYPKSIFATANGDIYFDNGYTDKRVERLRPNMNSSTSIMIVKNDCYGLFVDITNVLYCSLYDQHQVTAKSLNGTDDTWIVAAGTDCVGSSSNQLRYPLGIFVDTNLDLYVADCGNNRIQLFSANQVNGRTLPIVGVTDIYTLNCPSAVILDGDGYLFIVDSENHRILGSDSNGFRCIIGCIGAGSASNKLDSPLAFSFDSYGNIYVVDRDNSRIQKFNLIPTTYVRKYHCLDK